MFADTGALGQVWLFRVAPLAGTALRTMIWKSLLGRD
jgi:aquaporin Z